MVVTPSRHEATEGLQCVIGIPSWILLQFCGRFLQDMVAENQPPFVSTMITEYIIDTAPDEMFLYWRLGIIGHQGTGGQSHVILPNFQAQDARLDEPGASSLSDF